MADREHVALLFRSVAVWNESRQESFTPDLSEAELRGANLRGANLQRAILREANLIRANLTQADLIEANLRGANLHRADLIRADLTGANLIGANLRETNLREANLREANLIRTDLREANLIGANLIGANLIGANLYNIVHDGSTIWPERFTPPPSAHSPSEELRARPEAQAPATTDGEPEPDSGLEAARMLAGRPGGARYIETPDGRPELQPVPDRDSVLAPDEAARRRLALSELAEETAADARDANVPHRIVRKLYAYAERMRRPADDFLIEVVHTLAAHAVEMTGRHTDEGDAQDALAGFAARFWEEHVRYVAADFPGYWSEIAGSTVEAPRPSAEEAEAVATDAGRLIEADILGPNANDVVAEVKDAMQDLASDTSPDETLAPASVRPAPSVDPRDRPSITSATAHAGPRRRLARAGINLASLAHITQILQNAPVLWKWLKGIWEFLVGG